MKKLTTDVAIIGAGTAGMSAYQAVVKAGKSALLIEGGPYGTTCARVGCMPSKLLIAAADAAHAISLAPQFGVTVDGTVNVDGAQVMDRVRNERDRFVGFVLKSIDAIDPNNKIRGYARFTSDTTLVVDEHTQITASSIVIATGTTPVVPELYAPLGARAIVNDDVFNWSTLPKRVLVVGSGVIGMELGQALTRLGVQVCLVNRSASVAGLRDTKVKSSALAVFQAEMDMRLNTNVLAATLVGDEVEVQLKSDDGSVATLTVDCVLLATGRRPNLSGLALENTSLVLNEKGMPAIDMATLQLGDTPIFIAGDVTATLPVLHEANDEGHIAGRNAAVYPEIVVGTRRTPMDIVFTDPQIARVGATLRDLDLDDIVIGEVAYANQGRARIILKNQGVLHLYVAKKDGKLLGAEMAGPAMEHLAHLLAWSVQQGLSVHTMLTMPFYHPVLEEGLRTALRHAVSELAAAI